MKDNLLEGLEKDVAEGLKDWVRQKTTLPSFLLTESSEERIKRIKEDLRYIRLCGEKLPSGYLIPLKDLREGYVAMEQLMREYVIAIDRLLEEK